MFSVDKTVTCCFRFSTQNPPFNVRRDLRKKCPTDNEIGQCTFECNLIEVLVFFVNSRTGIEWSIQKIYLDSTAMFCFPDIHSYTHNINIASVLYIHTHITQHRFIYQWNEYRSNCSDITAGEFFFFVQWGIYRRINFLEFSLFYELVTYTSACKCISVFTVQFSNNVHELWMQQ